MYMRNTWHLGNDYIEIEHYYPGNYGAPGMPRGPKRIRSPEEIVKQNIRNREKRIQRLILHNFKSGDWHLVLNYRVQDRPPDTKAAKQDLRKWIAKMRAAYKKEGLTFKYIAVTEYGKKGNALHHHLVIEDKPNTAKLVKKFWKYGNTRWTDLYEEGEYKQLASYIVKKETKQEGQWSTYTRSRNLKEPKVKRQKLRRRQWSQEPKVKKEYELIKDSLVNGVNPFTGYPYQKYMMRKIVGGRNGSNDLYRNHPIRSG